MESSTIAIIITVVSMILFFSNKLPMSVVGSITALACGLLIPEMSKSSVYSSFGGSTVIMVAGMCVVGDALFVTGIAQKLGAKICNSPFAKNERIFVITVVTICTVMSAFLSNSACIAMCPLSPLLPQAPTDGSALRSLFSPLERPASLAAPVLWWAPSPRVLPTRCSRAMRAMRSAWACSI